MNISIPNRFGEKLEMLIKKPDEAGKYPVVILVPGIGASMHETNNSHDEIAQRLCDAGFAAVQFSFAGRGKSEGSYEDMTLSRQALQLEDVITWTKKQDFADQDKVGIYAMSFGVATTIRLMPQDIASFCFVSGAYHPYESLKNLFSKNGEVHEDGMSWRKFSNGDLIRLKPNFWQDVKACDMTGQLKKLTQPVCMIHGTADPKISCTEAEDVFSIIPSTIKKFLLIDGGDHGIIDVPPQTRQVFLKKVVQWFEDTL